MGQTKQRKRRGKRAEVIDTAPASMGLADAANDFTATQAIEAGQVTRVRVYRRRDRLDDLLNARIIGADGWRACDDYRRAWQEAGLDAVKSCLVPSMGGGSTDGTPMRIVNARRLFARLRAKVPPIAIETLDAVVLHNRTLEDIASDRAPIRQRSRASNYVAGRTNRASTARIEIVKRELLEAVRCLCVREARAA